MEASHIYPLVTVSCFLAAILFYRKKGVPLSRALPFLLTSLTPQKISEIFTKEGVWLIVLGFMTFIVYMVLF
jgi:hypothetical protein